MPSRSVASYLKEEEKFQKQKCYGHYCNKYRQLGIEPVSYTDFNLELWKKVRKRR